MFLSLVFNCVVSTHRTYSVKRYRDTVSVVLAPRETFRCRRYSYTALLTTQRGRVSLMVQPRIIWCRHKSKKAIPVVDQVTSQNWGDNLCCSYCLKPYTVKVGNPNTFGFWSPTHRLVVDLFERLKMTEIQTKCLDFTQKFLSEIRTIIVWMLGFRTFWLA